MIEILYLKSSTGKLLLFPRVVEGGEKLEKHYHQKETTQVVGKD